MVSGTGVTVSAAASAKRHRRSVQLDGANLGSEDTTAPYSISLGHDSVPNGPHTLSAVAHDAANNTGAAPGVGITVANLTTSTFTPVADTEVSI